MTKESGLAVYKGTDPLAFMKSVGTEITESRMLGCANEAQGRIVAMTCWCEGITPVDFGRKYHIINGNLSMRADAMLAEFRMRGGSHKVISRSAELATITLTLDGEEYMESFSWEEAKRERFVYGKDGTTVKDNWSTPRGRKQMLWARVCSDAVRTLCPEIVSGTYTPEEVGDFQVEATTVTPAKDAKTLMVETKEKAEKAEKETAVKDDEVVDAEFEVVDDVKEAAVVSEGSSTVTTKPSPADKYCSPEARNRIRELFGELNLSDVQIAKALSNRDVKAIRYLAPSQAGELIETLEGKLTDKLAGESRLPADVHMSYDSSAVDQVLVDEIKALLVNDIPATERLIVYLGAQGVSKISDLDHETAVSLKSALEHGKLNDFFGDDGTIPF